MIKASRQLKDLIGNLSKESRSTDTDEKFYDGAFS